MQIEYVARDFKLEEPIREFSEEKLKRLERFLQEPITAHLVLEVEKHRQRAEVHVSHRHGDLRAAEETDTMRDSIQLVVDKLEKRARRAAKKFQTTRRRADRHVQPEFWSEEVVESSRLHVKPMTIDEAALELDRSDTEFVVFREEQKGSVTVLYRRGDGDYGLITPEA
jgi:putative sigma-54 modulation protein